MDEIKIGTYTNNFKKGVTDLILTIQRVEFQIPITLEAQPDLDHIPSYYQAGNGNFWIARSGEKIIGTIGLLDVGNNQGALRKMFVETVYRGRESGVAQRLFDTLLGWAKEKGMEEIFLGTTEKFVAALRFYEKNGFIEIPKNDLPKGFPVMEVDVKFYRLADFPG